MSREHTPGPWIVWPNGSSGYEMRDPTRFVHKANYADARLIAAAPDLLEALRDLVARCDGPEGVRADGSNIETLAAHVAIAKAAGGIDEEVRHRSGCKQSKEE